MNVIKTLISKLNLTCYQALEKAASIGASRAHFNIELEHWLLAFIENRNSTLCGMLSESACQIDKITEDIHSSLECLKVGNDRAPAISDRILEVINEAWLITSLDYNQEVIHSGVILSVLIHKHTLQQLCLAISMEFAKLNPDNVRELMMLVFEENHENRFAGKDQSNKNIKTSALDQFTINLNEQAKHGKIDHAIGREDEINQIIDILSRRRQNNAILIGEPGVGKTAIVEGLALRIKDHEVPLNLNNVTIRVLDMGLLQAGAGVKGEFENRLKTLIEEIKSQASPIILFIDEAHMMIGAGASTGQGDAANLLKPALARGDLHCIAATTWSEYKRYFEKDAAFARRFQVVHVEEPDAESAIRMLRSLVSSLEKHHKVKIVDSAVQGATHLSQRYITGRQLPDKSISVLDTACSRVASQQTSKPARLEKLSKSIEQLTLELSNLEKEILRGGSHQARVKQLKKEIADHQHSLNQVTERWQKEWALTKKMIAVSDEIELVNNTLSAKSIKNGNKKLSKELVQLKKELRAIQGDEPLMQTCVDFDSVAKVIADWTGIPIGRMLNDEVARIMLLEKNLKKRIIGQDHALVAIASQLRISSAKLSDPNKPIGVFLFVGPSGVGKTETALALAEQIYHSEEKITVINMSEFKEEHKISMLAGSPPGYVGYGDGGVLTEAVRRKPYSIILLDEMEKAHPGVQELFYQVFDKGTLRDGQGQDINFRNSLIIMTSNVCSDSISKFCDQSEFDIDKLNESIHDELSRYFKSAFLGRLKVVPYVSLSDEMMIDIIKLKLSCIQKRIKSEHQVMLTFNECLINSILLKCLQSSLGARQVDNIISKEILPGLSAAILSHIADKKLLKSIQVAHSEEGGYWLNCS